MTEPLELWLVRHGETIFSASKRVAGWSDTPLTENGRRQAADLREFLDGGDFNGVWSSDLQRTIESARLAWGAAKPDGRLRECNFGALEGCSYEEADTTHGEVFRVFREFEIPGGETHSDFRDRVRSFVNDLGSGRHLLFVHGGVIRILTQDLGLDRFVPTCSVVAVDWRALKLQFVREPGNTHSPT